MNVNPSVDPADYDTLTGSLKLILRKMLQETAGMLPAIVVAFKRDFPPRAQVQPLIPILTTDGSTIARAPIASVPVLQLGAGGFFLSFNLKPGDLGWIKANDRDISLFLQSYSQAKPNTLRMKDFADSLFLPDTMRGYILDPEDAENFVLQNLDGSVKISLGADSIKIKSPSNIIEGDVTIEGDLTVTGATNLQGGMTCTGGSGANTFVIVGNQRVEGNIEATGDITPHVP